MPGPRSPQGGRGLAELEAFELVRVRQGLRAAAASRRRRPPRLQWSRAAAVRPAIMSLHISKLKGVDPRTRIRLKRMGVSYTNQLLAMGRHPEERRVFAARSGIADALLVELLGRADLARIRGIGAVFADMLNGIGVRDTATLAAMNPAQLHARLVALNAAEHVARRSPTPEEVADWIDQAKALPWRFAVA